VLPDLEVTATGTYEGQRFVTLVLTGKTLLPAAELASLIEPAKRVCYVSNTFAHALVVEVEVEVA
jgi:putative redox protein